MILNVATDPAIRLNLITPSTRVGFGPFQFDLFKQLAGVSLAELLEPVLDGDISRQPSPMGTTQEVYPLALPDGEGMAIPIPPLGELGFRNDAGELVLTVPAGMAAWTRDQLRGALSREPVSTPSLDGSARVVALWCRLRPGRRLAFQIPVLGEFAVQIR